MNLYPLALNESRIGLCQAEVSCELKVCMQRTNKPLQEITNFPHATGVFVGVIITSCHDRNGKTNQPIKKSNIC